MINRQNYEIWFLDFLEGNLSEKKISILMDFLAENGDLKAEFDDMELVELPTEESLVFTEKEQLKRPLLADMSLSSDDKLLIGQLEGVLTEKQMLQLQQQLTKNPALQKAQNIYQSTLLQVDLTEKYPNKEHLKHKDSKIFPLRLALQIAAASLLLVALVFALKKENIVQVPIVQTPDEQIERKLVPEQKNKVIEPVQDVQVFEPVVQVPTQVLPKKKVIKSKQKNIEIITHPEEIVQESQSVAQMPKSAPKKNVPQMQTPPKPILKPQLPDPKPVIVHQSPESEQVKPNSVPSSTRLIALNEPKKLFRSVMEKGFRKATNTEHVKGVISIPEAIVSTVGTITKTKTAFQHEKTEQVSKTCIRIGKFKFSRIRRSR